MQDANVPAKFPIPWANAAGAGAIRTIPTASQIGVQNGAASLTDGFPPNCLIPIAAGGSWPFGQDMNGILKQLTAWARWLQAGGPLYYDATFSAAIGGYPLGAQLADASTPGLFWTSTADNNTTDPTVGGANWIVSFSHNTTSGGMIHRFPDGIIDLSFTTLINFSGAGYFGNTITYPVAFPHNTFDIMISYSGNTPPLGGVTVSAEPIDRFTCQLTTNSTGFGVSGVVAMNVRVRGN
jgi:hypothetical protein